MQVGVKMIQTPCVDTSTQASKGSTDGLCDASSDDSRSQYRTGSLGK